MEPAQPPFPTAWSFPFHPDVGSHTSILMSESDDGVSVPAIRQKEGRRLNGGAAVPVLPGGVNPPAGTGWAMVIVVCGNASDANVAQDGVGWAVWAGIGAGRRTTLRIAVKIFMTLPLCEDVRAINPEGKVSN
jgi:hypothetical protein